MIPDVISIVKPFNIFKRKEKKSIEFFLNNIIQVLLFLMDVQNGHIPSLFVGSIFD